MQITFHGGAGEVTGSRYLIETEYGNVLMDCGMFQGHRGEAIEKNRRFPFSPKDLTAVLLSHAHIDHCGSLPLLVKSGFKGPIYCTNPTTELCEIMLLDSAHLQEEDAKFFNKIHQSDGQTIEPLYNQDDVRDTLKLFAPRNYGEDIALAANLSARFTNAGHVLGSAMIQVDIGTGAKRRRVFYTGDLGRRNAILMEPPVVPVHVDYLLIESTYGDHLHPAVVGVEDILSEIIEETVREKGKLLIPSFAFERTQEIVFILEKMRRAGRIPQIPLIVDSPMAVNITTVFNKHLSHFSFDAQFIDYVAKQGDPFGFETVRYIRTPEESQSLNNRPGPLIILSASGMCEGGRILHHLRNNIDKPNTTILLVGYQAEGTLGRRLLEGAKKVKIFGLEHPVVAQVRSMQFFSAHADQNDLLWFVKSLATRPRQVFLVHGDPTDRTALTSHLQAAGIDRVQSPRFGDSFPLD
jgi:metallo-beta-lactamase family protein